MMVDKTENFIAGKKRSVSLSCLTWFLYNVQRNEDEIFLQ